MRSPLNRAAQGSRVSAAHPTIVLSNVQMTDWPPPKSLPPGYPLPSVDTAGRPITVGAKVRIVSVASCARGLPREDQLRLKSFEGAVFEVLEIDRYGMLWFGSDGDGGNFSLRPGEVTVV